MELQSRENPRVRDYVRLRENRTHRRKTGRFVLEGARLVGDALQNAQAPEAVFFTAQACQKHPALYAQARQNGTALFEISDAVAARMADTAAPQGVFAVAFVLDKAFALDKINLGGAYVALENVSDPGNVGTILRTAEALGLDGALLSPGCADVWSPKVVRASMGAVLRLPLWRAEDLPAALGTLRAAGMQTLAALPDRAAPPLDSLSLAGGVAAVFGNEGDGLTPAAAAACAPFTIPMRGRAESLCVASAAAIAMWAVMRGR